MRQKVGNLFEVGEEMHVANNIYVFSCCIFAAKKFAVKAYPLMIRINIDV